jgi:hypothetical protein
MASYLLEEYRGANSFSFPNPNRAPAKKNEKEYILAVAKGMYSVHAREKTAITPTRQEKFHINREYGRGQQSSEYYEKLLINSENVNTPTISNSNELARERRQSWKNIDFEHKVSYAPKVADHFYGLFLDMENDVVGDAIDPDSGEEMRSKKLKMLAELYWMKELKEFRNVAKQKEPKWNFFPRDKEELDLFEAQGGFKLNFTKAMEKLAKHTFESSGWDQLKKHYVNDILDTGFAIGKVTEDPNSGEVVVDYMDPEYTIVQHSNYWDFRDIEFIGEIKPWTCTSLSKYFTTEELREVIKKFAGQMGNSSDQYFTNKGYNFKDEDLGYFKVPVLQFHYLDYEDDYKKEYTNSYKQKRLIRVEYDYTAKNNNEKVKITRKWYVYTGCWVVGSDLLFNYGKEQNQLRDGKEPVLPYGVFKLADLPITERLIPLYDQLEITWLRFQNAQAQASLSGHAINMRLLSNVTLGGEPVSPIDALKFMKSVGDLIYSDLDMSDPNRYYGGEVNPVHPIEGGMKSELEEGIQKFEWTIRMIEHITGLSNVSMGTQADVQAAVGTTKLAAEGSYNIIQPNFAAITFLKGKMAREVMWSIQLKLRYDDKMRKHYSGIIGKKDVEAIRLADKRGAKFGIHFEARPTRDEKMDLYRMIEEALKSQALTGDEAWMIRQGLLSGENLKDLGLKLAYKIRKRSEQAAEKEFAARQQQHKQNMEYKQQEFQQEMAKQKLISETELQKEQIRQQGVLTKTDKDNLTKLQELINRLQDDERDRQSKERIKLAELSRNK